MKRRLNRTIVVALVGVLVALGTTGQAQDEPAHGGTLSWVIDTDATFHTVIGTDRPSAYAGKLVFEGLTRVDDTLTPVPQLAESWSVSDDGLTWTFELHPDVLWHDGTPFTAEDVKFTFDHYLDPEISYRYASNFSAVEEVRVVDDTTVQFVTSSQFAPLPAMLSYYAGILPKHLLEGDFLGNERFNLEQPVGTGPFRVTEVRRGSSITFEANEDYYRGRPYLDRIIVRIVGDPDTRVAQMLAGELDLMDYSPGRHQEVLSQQPNLSLVSYPTTNFNHAKVNHRDPKYQDPRVIKALMHSIDRQAIIDSVMLGNAVLPTQVIPSSIAWAYDDDLDPYAYDVDLAAQLMRDAGYTMGEEFWEKDGEAFSFTISADNVDTARRETAIIAQQYWRDFGFDVELEVLEWSVWLPERFRAVPDMTMGYWSTPTDPNHSSYWTCDGSINYLRYCNEDVDALFAEGVRELDRGARADIYKEIQRIMHEEDPPLVIFYYINESIAMTDRLRGFPALQVRDALDWANEWWLASE
jgi:peptide/nickel transport system substrate-binding protein